MKWQSWSILFISAATGFSGFTFTAQAGTDDAAAFEIPEIVVTAQKRSQKISDVGITIVAKSGDELQSAGVYDVTDLTKVVPGFNAVQSMDGYPIFSIRGVNFNATQVSASPTVSTYVDEASLPYPMMTAGMLLDVERIEVLKGPQGTLFGQNATGGSINVIANKPTSDFEAGLHTEVNNFGQIFGEAYVSGPLTSSLNARFSGMTTQLGAWQQGYTNNQKNGDQNKGAARLLLDWQPMDQVKVGLNLNWNYDRGEPQEPQFQQFNFGNPANAAPGTATYPPTPQNDRAADSPSGFHPRSDNRQYQAVLRVDYSISDKLKLTSISNYVDSANSHLANYNGISIPINYATQTGEAKSVGQELRITGSAPSIKLNYLVGANYQDDRPLKDDIHYDEIAYSTTPPNTQIGGTIEESNRTAAAFSNADLEIVQGLTATLGARYTQVKQRFIGCGNDLGDGSWAALNQYLSGLFRGAEGLAPLPDGTFAPGECTTLNDLKTLPGGLSTFAPYEGNFSQTQSNVSWRAGLDWKPTPDTLVYGLVSRGYKSGGFPAVVAVVASEFVPISQEKLTSYEVGTKLALLEHRLEFNTSVFYYDYVDKQLYTYTSTVLGVAATETNIPKSSVKGVDWSVQVYPLTGLELSAGFTYIATRLDEGSGYDILNRPGNFAGKRFNFAPPWSGSGDAQYKFRVMDRVEGLVGVSTLFNTQTYSDLVNSAASRLPSYITFDARVGVMSGRHWNASIWGRNLADRYYWTNVISTGDGITRYTGMPRTFGVSFGMNF